MAAMSRRDRIILALLPLARPPGRWLAGLGLLLLLAPGCREPSPSGAVPTLAQLDAQDDVKAAGLRLMEVPLGLHRLDTATPEPSRVVVGVHGHGSRGYEWVQPLSTAADGGAQVQFFRWDWDQCPEPAAARLRAALDGLLRAQPDVERVQLLAHSYGGVIAAVVAADYDGTVPLIVDVIASPLAGLPELRERCGYEGPRPPADGVTLRQWRTRKELDGAFESMAMDPQVVELPGEVTRLPETYRGHRLGHNWSISWVVDHLAGDAPP